MARARRLVRRSNARLLRDPFLIYTAALAPIALIVALISREPRDLPTVGILSPIAVGLQAVLGVIPARVRPMTKLGWSFLRLAITLLYVAGLAELVGGHTHPMFTLYIPVVVPAATLGTSQAAVIGALASLIIWRPNSPFQGLEPKQPFAA